MYSSRTTCIALLALTVAAWVHELGYLWMSGTIFTILAILTGHEHLKDWRCKDVSVLVESKVMTLPEGKERERVMRDFVRFYTSRKPLFYLVSGTEGSHTLRPLRPTNPFPNGDFRKEIVSLHYNEFKSKMRNQILQMGLPFRETIWKHIVKYLNVNTLMEIMIQGGGMQNLRRPHFIIVLSPPVGPDPGSIRVVLHAHFEKKSANYSRDHIIRVWSNDFISNEHDNKEIRRVKHEVLTIPKSSSILDLLHSDNAGTLFQIERSKLMQIVSKTLKPSLPMELTNLISHYAGVHKFYEDGKVV